jgi:DNA-binding response OmpR family regulator
VARSVLVVEDDPAIGDLLRVYLTKRENKN